MISVFRSQMFLKEEIPKIMLEILIANSKGLKRMIDLKVLILSKKVLVIEKRPFSWVRILNLLNLKVKSLSNLILVRVSLRILKVHLLIVRLKIRVISIKSRVEAWKEYSLNKDIKLKKNLYNLRILFSYKKRMRSCLKN
jgi:hypothetical protein